MRIIIAGAGAVGTHLAKMLSDERHDIVLMDPEEERLTKLESNFDLMTVAARTTSINSLKDVGVANADLFVAVTPEESTNITSCILASPGQNPPPWSTPIPCWARVATAIRVSLISWAPSWATCPTSACSPTRVARPPGW